MSNELPPLPHPVTHILLGDDSEDVFTADQMRDFARAAVLQEREARAALAAQQVPPDTAIQQLQEQKDGAYLERNRCVAALARMALALGQRAGRAKTAIDGWDPAWHGCIYIDLPTGQVSWHYHESQSDLFTGLPEYAGRWDGHDTPTKYERLAAAFPALAAAPQAPAVQSAPTTYLQRFGDALALLCSGLRPTDDMMAAWLDIAQDDHRLQEFAIEHGPSWAQGIGVIDAARVLADQPEEDAGHEEAPQVPADEARRQAQAEAAKLKGDILKIATAITNAGFTLIQTEHGYQVRKFGPAVAQTAAPGTPQPAEPAPLTDEQVLAAARELNKLEAERCGVDEAGSWKQYGNACIIDASKILRAARLVAQTPLTYTQLMDCARAADWPPSMISAFVQAKLEVFARAIEAAHGIRAAGVKEPT